MKTRYRKTSNRYKWVWVTMLIATVAMSSYAMCTMADTQGAEVDDKHHIDGDARCAPFWAPFGDEIHHQRVDLPGRKYPKQRVVIASTG